MGNLTGTLVYYNCGKESTTRVCVPRSYPGATYIDREGVRKTFGRVGDGSLLSKFRQKRITKRF